MQTRFSLAQLADPNVQAADKILRNCVHCGFCTATCPTFVLLGDELDSPRGRIYLIKEMLESGRPASETTVKHVDRCLTCLSCMTTCPSGVDYMHLVDRARVHIEKTYRRPFLDRWLRRLLTVLVPYPTIFRLGLTGAMFGRPFAKLFPGRLGAILKLAPASLASPSSVDRPQVFPAEGAVRARVALMTGCAQQVLSPQINEATVRLLTRHGCEVAVAKGAGCCGALTYHLGMESQALASARRNVAAWGALFEGHGPDAVVINASGCGTTVKDYGHMLKDDPAWSGPAARIAELTRDVSELMTAIGLKEPVKPLGLKVAYHSACSMQHGQKITAQPKALLQAAGFTVVEPAESHLCCGSAGTYNMLQPEIADRLCERKVANLERLTPDVVATGNIGCLTQIQGGTAVPVVHTVELLDWATGGPCPPALVGRVG